MELLNTETKFLPLIADNLSLPIPKPQYSGKPSPKYEWPFCGYKFLPGKAACLYELTRLERVSLAKPLAQFLRQLHNMPVNSMMASVLKPDEIGKLDVQKLGSRIEQYLATVTDDSLGQYANLIAKVLHDCKNLEWTARQKITHGDFYSRHILLTENKQISGIIDWGDTMLADPAVDLSVIHSFLPVDAHDGFTNEYGQIEKNTWMLARLRGLFYGVSLTAFGFDTREPVIFKEGLNTLSLISESV